MGYTYINKRQVDNFPKMNIIIFVLKSNIWRKFMKKLVKKYLLFLLVIVVAATTVSPMIASAAKRGRVQNLVMYIGEAYESTDYSQVKSIKNTNKSVVKTSKSKISDKKVVFEAKKVGKAKITYVTKTGTVVINVTVKKSKFEYKLYSIGKGEILVEVTNKTGAIFQDGKFRYSLKGADGTEHLSELISVYSLMPNKKSYAKIVFNASAFEPDVTKTGMKMVSLSRSPAYTYTNAEKKFKVKDSIKSQVEDQVVVSVNTKNTGKIPVSGNVFIVFYDASGAPINFVSRGVYLKPGLTDTSDAICYLNMINFETKERIAFGKYKVFKNVYTSVYTKK